jgi:hypothetical protein
VQLLPSLLGLLGPGAVISLIARPIGGLVQSLPSLLGLLEPCAVIALIARPIGGRTISPVSLLESMQVNGPMCLLVQTAILHLLWRCIQISHSTPCRSAPTQQWSRSLIKMPATVGDFTV